MAGVAGLLGKAVYLDTNVFVYAAEGFARYKAFIEGLFREIDAGHVDAVTSELTLAELLVKPLEIGRQDIADLYAELIQSSDQLIVIPIDRSILMAAARYRAQLKIKLPDAIHVATAVAAGCERFLSNDRNIKTPAGLTLQKLG